MPIQWLAIQLLLALVALSGPHCSPGEQSQRARSDSCWISQAQASIVLRVWQSFLDAAESQQLSQQPAALHKQFAESIWNFVVQAVHDEEAWFLVRHLPLVSNTRMVSF